MKKSILAVAAACVLIAGCGGGSEHREQDRHGQALALLHDAAVLNEAGASGRRRALATTGTFSTDLSTQLFDLAESSYAAYFPSKQSTRTFGDWVYRFYPETGTYLAVIGSGVYVLGGAFGTEVRRVGDINEFVGQPPVGKDRPLTATLLDQCPEAMYSSSPGFYKCMVGYLAGAQTFDSSKSCRLEVTSEGVLALSSGGQVVSVGPAMGFVLYTKFALTEQLLATVRGLDGEGELSLKTGQGFSFTAGGVLDAEGKLPGSSTASIACKLNVPR